MKCLITKVCICLLLVPITAMAGWQVVQSSSTPPSNAFFPVGGTAPFPTSSQRHPTYSSVAVHPTCHKYVRPLRPLSSAYAISVSGSLKENIERIMDRYHWRVIWKVPYDYNFDGRVTGTSLPNVIEKILKPFPLQATLYMSNRTMVVTSRSQDGKCV